MDAAAIAAVQQALKDLRFGHVQLTVHEGRLVRVERLERLRIDTPIDPSTTPTGDTRRPHHIMTSTPTGEIGQP